MGIPKNLGWKLGSLLLAVLLWLAFSSAPLVVTTHTAPIVYNNLANGWMVAGNSPETVHLELRGPAGRLTVASLAETVVRFDLANAGSAEDRTFTISESNLNLPPGVAFLRAVPSQLRLRLARLAREGSAGRGPILRRPASRISTDGTKRFSGPIEHRRFRDARRVRYPGSNRPH